MINSLVALTVFALIGCAPEKVSPCTDGEFAVVEEDAPDVITCLNLTVCSDTEYETQAPTYSSDRQCEPITSCAPGEVVLSSPTATSDRECTPCSLGETYSDTENASECTLVTECQPHEYIATAATVTSDLECGDCQTDVPVDNGECLSCMDSETCITVDCQAGFTPANGSCLVAATPANAECTLDADGLACACTEGHFGTLEWDSSAATWEGQCTVWSDCAPGTRVIQNGTATTDRLCEPCTEGLDHSSTTNAIECIPVTECPPGEAIATPPTLSSDRICVSCVAGVDFSTSPNASSCTPVTDCQPGEVITIEASTTADRSCDSCTAGVNFSMVENATECTPVSDCLPGAYEVTPPTAQSDRSCVPCDLGLSYSSGPNAPGCTPVTDCLPGEYEIAPPSLTADRDCDSCTQAIDYSDTVNATACTPVTICEPGEYITASPSLATDRSCAPCNAGIDFSTTDNATACTPVTDCQAGEYISCEATPTTDRSCGSCVDGFNFSDGLNESDCTPVSDCVAGEFIQANPTAISDRVCLGCDLGIDFAEGPNAIECTPLTTCQPGEYTSSPATTETDRGCSPCSEGLNYSTAPNAESCSPVQDCNPGQFVLQAPTIDSDRVCGSCTLGVTFSNDLNASDCQAVQICASNEYETTAPTLTQDRSCEVLSVSVDNIDGVLHEGGLESGLLQVSLSAIQDTDTDIEFSVSGSATLNEDYTLEVNGTPLTSPLTIPSGVLSIDIQVTPIATPALEVEEHIAFGLNPSLNYDLSSHTAALSVVEYGPSNGTVYVVDENGDDTNIGDENSPFATIGHAVTQLSAGDILYIKDGTYTNSGHTATHGTDGNTNVNNGLLARLTASGTADNWITIAAYPDGNEIRPLLKFDGLGGIQIQSGANYIRIEGLEIQGPNQEITHTWAHEHRWSKESFYTGRGIYSWDPVHHIVVQNCNVHHTPGSGIRFNKADYILVQGNIVSNTTWWSTSAESAIVIATAESIDTEDVVKFLYSGNVVYNNWNFMEFCNSPLENSTADEYGNCDDYTGGIIDGQGLYVTRNNATYLHGRMRFENNIAFNNGFGGVVYHKTDRGELVNNLVFQNGAYPGLSNYTGMTVNTADDLLISNNIIWARDGNDYGLKNNGNASNVVATDNYVVGLSQFGTQQDNTFILFSEADNLAELFVNVVDISISHPDPHATSGDFAPMHIDEWVQGYDLDFQLLETAVDLIDMGDGTIAPSVDFNGVVRPQGGGVDIGPHEWD